jgi:hypothetical protein
MGAAALRDSSLLMVCYRNYIVDITLYWSNGKSAQNYKTQRPTK